MASGEVFSDRRSLVATPSLQRGFASDRPLATIWYRSAAFLMDDLRNQNRKLYVKMTGPGRSWSLNFEMKSLPEVQRPKPQPPGPLTKFKTLVTRSRDQEQGLSL